MKKLAFFLAFILISGNAIAYSGDLSISGNGIKTNKNTILEGQSFRIYSQISNNSKKDLLGIARFYLNNKQVGSDRQISVLAGKIDDVFVDTRAENYGTQKIKVQIFPWESENDNPSNNTAELEIKILRDTDRDGTANENDSDDDNDGVPDEKDAFPLDKSETFDTDGDGKGNNADEDDDNDGVPDTFDEMPLDPNETMDTDSDGIGNVKDSDDDNDGLSDAEEENLGTNPLKSDSDNDSVNDLEDSFPLNPNEQFDFDKDGIGDNEDTDDDNDGLPDEKDEYPLNKGPLIILSKENPKAFYNKDFQIDAKKSYDPDGEIKQIKWRLDGKTYFGEKLNLKFLKKGQKNIEIEITDNTGEKRQNTFQVSVISVQKYYLISSIILTISLAMVILLKYISTAKKEEK